MDSENERIRVLMLPYLAHGHTSSFLELAKRLSHYNFHVLLCSTPANFSSIKSKISEKDTLNIQLVELHLPPLPELPPHYHTANGLPPHLAHLLPKVLQLGEPNFSEILQKLRPDLLIHDTIVPWAGETASRLNIPSVLYYTANQAAAAYFCNVINRPGEEFPFPALRLTDLEMGSAMKDLKPGGSHETGHESPPHDEIKAERNDEISEKKDAIMLVNSCRVMEGKYMDYFTELVGWSVLPVGALVQEPNLGDDDTHLMEWLEKKDELSTVFVSFGSEHFLKKEEIDEMAYALELSNVNFIWVIRFAKGDRTRAAEVLPEGFLERVGERGRIFEKLAPQAAILSHRSVGGFVSHCGWNSTLETINIGVPVIGMPIQVDQPIIAKLVVELGVGVEVKRDGGGMYRREAISRVITDVVFGERGRELRTNMRELRETVRSRSREELDGAVRKLREICGKDQDS